MKEGYKLIKQIDYIPAQYLILRKNNGNDDVIEVEKIDKITETYLSWIIKTNEGSLFFPKTETNNMNIELLKSPLCAIEWL